MKICVFDTETTSLEKPFCYNIGYLIYDTEKAITLLKREYVIEQIWHNLPLFSTAYYAEKRPIYVEQMKAKKIKLIKFGYAMRQMRKDFKDYNVNIAFAYNSNFDDKVFNFNCDWFKVNNPFETIEIQDIRKYFIATFGTTEEYKGFCIENNLLTQGNNYSTTAETAYKYITNNLNFVEAHTALNDAEIELEILMNSITQDEFIEPTAPRFLEHYEDKISQIYVDDEEKLKVTYKKVWKTKDLRRIKFKTK